MLSRIVATGLAGTVLLLAACAPKPAPEPIYPAPSYDKYGEPSCSEGYAASADGQRCLPVPGRMPDENGGGDTGRRG